MRSSLRSGLHLKINGDVVSSRIIRSMHWSITIIKRPTLLETHPVMTTITPTAKGATVSKTTCLNSKILCLQNSKMSIEASYSGTIVNV
jgi:hypothetical protein